MAAIARYQLFKDRHRPHSQFSGAKSLACWNSVSNLKPAASQIELLHCATSSRNSEVSRIHSMGTCSHLAPTQTLRLTYLVQPSIASIRH